MNAAPENSSILYICQNAIGDIITTLPSIHFLRQLHPDSRLDVCVSTDYADIFAADRTVSSVISAPREWFSLEAKDVDGSIKRLPGFQPQYAVVVDSMCSKRTAELTTLLHPRVAAGIGFDETVHVYNLPLCLENWRTWSTGGRTAPDCFGDLVRLFESNYSPTEPVLHVTESAEDQGREWLRRHCRDSLPVVALNPGAGHPMKRWPMQRFVELAADLSSANYQPLFIFGPNEVSLFDEYGERIKAMDGMIFRSRTSAVQPLAGVLRQCALLVTNDCGVMHVGAAAGCRVLAVFGPTESRIWFPYSRTRNRIVQRDVDCRLSSHEGCEVKPCLTGITTAEVLCTALSMLGEN